MSAYNKAGSLVIVDFLKNVFTYILMPVNLRKKIQGCTYIPHCIKFLVTFMFTFFYEGGIVN